MVKRSFLKRASATAATASAPASSTAS
ncbi:MAG: hypothetical protein DRP90_02940 [Planctomycetota bacterium]|nr:MAG: hypothetical protein DRP90_02940 [Planctomycetota bacterium]